MRAVGDDENEPECSREWPTGWCGRLPCDDVLRPGDDGPEMLLPRLRGEGGAFVSMADPTVEGHARATHRPSRSCSPLLGARTIVSRLRKLAASPWLVLGWWWTMLGRRPGESGLALDNEPYGDPGASEPCAVPVADGVGEVPPEVRRALGTGSEWAGCG